MCRLVYTGINTFNLFRIRTVQRTWVLTTVCTFPEEQGNRFLSSLLSVLALKTAV